MLMEDVNKLIAKLWMEPSWLEEIVNNPHQTLQRLGLEIKGVKEIKVLMNQNVSSMSFAGDTLLLNIQEYPQLEDESLLKEQPCLFLCLCIASCT